MLNFDFLFITAQQGLVLIDVPATSSFIHFAVSFFLMMLFINFVLGILKRIPFL